MPGWTRTNDPQLRRLMLYPTELRAHGIFPYITRILLTSSNMNKFKELGILNEDENTGRKRE